MSERAMKVAREIVNKWRGTLKIGSGMREIESENLCRRIAAALDAFQPEWLERDRVWCQALIETLPIELIHAVTARMMESRPDQPVPQSVKDATDE